MGLCSLRATKCPKARKEYGKDNESNQKCSLSPKLVPWKWNAPIWIAPTWFAEHVRESKELLYVSPYKAGFRRGA